MVLRPVENPGLGEAVYQAIREAILDGRFQPGDHLVEAAIASQLNVSRATVRDAIQSLTHEGLVVSVPRRGASVRRLSPHDVWEIYTLRASLERLAFEIAYSQRGSLDLGKAEQIVEEMEVRAAERNIPALSDLDVAFHRSIVELSNNARLVDAWDRMMAQIQLLSGRVLSTLYSDLSVVPERHRQLMGALRGDSEEEAVQMIEEHIRSVDARIVRELEGDN